MAPLLGAVSPVIVDGITGTIGVTAFVFAELVPQVFVAVTDTLPDAPVVPP